MWFNDLKEIGQEITKAIWHGLRYPFKDVLRVSIQHPLITQLFLLLGAVAFFACLQFIFPLELAIGLGVLCFLAAWSLIPLGVKLLLPRYMHSKRMLGAPNWIVSQGLIFFLCFVGLGCLLWFVPTLWVAWLFVMLLPLEFIVFLRLGFSDYYRDSWLGKRLFYYFHSIQPLLPSEDWSYWEKRAEYFTKLSLIAEIADSYFNRKLRRGVQGPEMLGHEDAFYWYRHLEAVCKLEAPEYKGWGVDPRPLRMLLRVRVANLHAEGSGGAPRDLDEASRLFKQAIDYSTNNRCREMPLLAEYREQALAGLEKIGSDQVKLLFLTAVREHGGTRRSLLKQQNPLEAPVTGYDDHGPLAMILQMADFSARPSSEADTNTFDNSLGLVGP